LHFLDFASAGGMAKGLRASTKKANRAKLRSKVFGPVEDARMQRLSSRLLDIASRPQSKATQDVGVDESGRSKRFLRF
jgi:hypothetical protein